MKWPRGHCRCVPRPGPQNRLESSSVVSVALKYSLQLNNVSNGETADDKLIEYVLRNGDDLSFTKQFWKDCEPSEKDIRKYREFTAVMRLSYQGSNNNVIATKFRLPVLRVKKWVDLVMPPKLGHFLRAYMGLREPTSDRVWLTINCSVGHGLPLGPFIQVSMVVNSWRDIENVINQLQPLEPVPVSFSRHYLFGFLLGMIIGDAPKSKQERSHRHLGLVLSKRYDTNLKIGEFTSQCARFLGLRMRRAKDLPRPARKPHGFYQWTSQSSPLIDWIFNLALGLDDGQVTTYDPIRAVWVEDTPEDFRLGLLQGIAESDASVSISGQEVEFWIGPNWDFMRNLLASFGLHSFRSREAVSLSKSEAVKAFSVPIFSPELQTVRYERLRRLATGKRPSQGGDRLPQEVRDEIGQLKEIGLSLPRIIERILDKHGLMISYEAAQSWATRHVHNPS